MKRISLQMVTITIGLTIGLSACSHQTTPMHSNQAPSSTPSPVAESSPFPTQTTLPRGPASMGELSTPTPSVPSPSEETSGDSVNPAAPSSAPDGQEGKGSSSLGSLQTPSPTDATAQPSPVAQPDSVAQRSQIKASTKPIRGVYVPYRHLHSKKWSEIIDLLNKTDLNAVVLDVKTDGGQVTVPSSDPLTKAAGVVPKPITPEFIKGLKDQGIYTIARITTFKDPHMAELRPQLSLQSKGGGVWHDAKGVAWLDPYRSEVRSYAISLAKAAAAAGFDEVQFDYVRFPENGAKVDRQVRYANPNGTSKAEIIAAFLKEAKDQLASTPIRISADVFGLTTSAADDMGIGQDWSRLTTTADILCPMVYPSHYAKGTYGVAQPDLQPYLIIQRAVQAGLAKNRKVQTSASIRPWLQDFTAKWVKPHQTYGTEQVREQVKALEESGIYEFLLWNPNASYSYR